MSSSKFPSDWVSVPQQLIAINPDKPDIYLNLRPNQRPHTVDEVDDRRNREYSDSYTVHYRLYRYLLELAKESETAELRNKKMALLFQGYGTEGVAATIIHLQRVMICGDGYPRLDFEHSPLVAKVSCPNFWGAFILALAPVSCLEPFEEKLDPDGSHFLHLVEKYGWTS